VGGAGTFFSGSSQNHHLSRYIRIRFESFHSLEPRRNSTNANQIMATYISSGEYWVSGATSVTNMRQSIVLAAEYHPSTAGTLSVHRFPRRLESVCIWGDFPTAAVHAQKLDAGIVSTDFFEP